MSGLTFAQDEVEIVPIGMPADAVNLILRCERIISGRDGMTKRPGAVACGDGPSQLDLGHTRTFSPYRLADGITQRHSLLAKALLTPEQVNAGDRRSYHWPAAARPR